MRASELYRNTVLCHKTLTSESDVISYMKLRDKMLRENFNIDHEYTRNWRRAAITVLTESNLPDVQDNFLQKFKSFDEYNTLGIKEGKKVAILNAEISGDRFDIWGFINLKTITKIHYAKDGEIMQFEFNNDPEDVWPRVENAEYRGKFLSHSIFFSSTNRASQALTTLLLSKPEGIEIKTHIVESISEGGWDSTATQGTVIHPSTVKVAMKVMQQYVDGFNQFAASKDIPPMKIGAPTGSSAWHDEDEEEKIYGDIDLQVIVPEIDELKNATNSGIQSFWNKLTDEFVATVKPSYVHHDSSPGHPIISIGDDKWVQIDLMYHTEKMSGWGRYRVTPERGLKGLLHGNLFSVLGQTLNMSIQHSGVQLKVRDNVRVSYSMRKNTELKTVTTDIQNFIKDIFDYEYANIIGGDPNEAYLDQELKRNPGIDTNNIKAQTLVNGIKGLARSFELNDMYGKGSLSNYSNSSEYLNEFWRIYEAKAMKDINSGKRDKAATPDAKARADADIEKIQTGLAKVKAMF